MTDVTQDRVGFFVDVFVKSQKCRVATVKKTAKNVCDDMERSTFADMMVQCHASTGIIMLTEDLIINTSVGG